MKRIYLILIFIFIAIEVSLTFLIYFNYKKNKEIFLNSYTKNLKTITSINIKSLNTLSQTIFDLNINTPFIQKIMYEASITKDPKKLDLLRKKLYAHLQKTYKYLKNIGFRQLHFFLPDITSFLRVHKPSKYGDSLKDIRDTFEYVAKYKQEVHFYEEGKVGNGFRNVYPIFYKGKFVGGVEVSYSFLALGKELSKSTNYSFVFITNEKNAKEKSFKNVLKTLYKKSEFKNFYYDKATFIHHLNIPITTIFKINSFIAKQIENKLQKGEEFSITFKNYSILNNKLIVITFIPIYNIKHHSTAYIIYYQLGKLIEIMKNKTILFWIFSSISGILITIIIFLFLKHQEKQKRIIEHRAKYDNLTKIYNRYGLNEEFKNVISSKNKFSIIFCDIDYFKQINDTYGHDAGDEVLKKVASILKSSLRETDVIGRWGGEEFVIILKDTPLENATKVAEKLRKKIENSNFNLPRKVTCSFGVIEADELDINNLLKKADELLYKAKKNGRNRVEF